MSKRELETIVREWQERLGLATWDISVDWGVMEEEEGRASVWRSRDYDEARIRFNREFRKLDTLGAHRLVVHELLHLLSRDVEHILDLLEDQLHRDVGVVARRSHEHAVEQMVERLAYRFVEIAGVR